MGEEPYRNEIEAVYRDIQTEICHKIEAADGSGKFKPDAWKRREGGGGLSRVMQHGKVLEKAGVNFSAIEGTLTPAMQKSLEVAASQFFATGVSIVMHPFNPHVPIIHMNIRYFETDEGTYWFGGGIDLTPHYVVPAQAAFFHRRLKEVCDRFSPEFYPRFKERADEYFFIPHRNETRGVGGIFYDHLKAEGNTTKKDLFEFSVALGRLFAEIYTELIELNRDEPFSEVEKEWQYLRRGRYVEFNLVYDRGTRFGLYSNGRTESILMSLPEQAKWLYNHQPREGSREAETIGWLRKGVDWFSVGD